MFSVEALYAVLLEQTVQICVVRGNVYQCIRLFIRWVHAN